MGYRSETYAPWVATYGLREPYGKCQCGCGMDAPIAKYSDHRRGTRHHEPQRLVNGHANRLKPYRPRYKSLLDAFNAQVERGAPDQCWDAHSCYVNGYGSIYFNRRQHYAHRVAYRLFVGLIPDGPLVCHKCDRRQCANPAHLFLGTVADNAADMVAKGRSIKGRRHWNYKTGVYVGQYKHGAKRRKRGIKHG